MHNPFRYFNSSPEVIRLAVMMYIRYPLSLRQIEDLLFERGIEICHETVRFWWNRFGPMFAAEIRKRRVHNRSYSLWRWHLDEVFVRINGEMHYFWRAVDHEGEVLEVFATKPPQGWPKGSKWWKWDLHVHSPASHGFAGDWNEFTIQLGNADCDVAGINDYFSVAGDKEILRRLIDPAGPRLRRTAPFRLSSSMPSGSPRRASISSPSRPADCTNHRTKAVPIWPEPL